MLTKKEGCLRAFPLPLFSFFLHKPDELFHRLLIGHLGGVHLIAHLGHHHLRHALAHDDALPVTLQNLLMGMDIAVTVTPAGIDSAGMLPAVGELPLVVGHHVCPDLIHVRGMGKVNHVRRIAPGRTHIDLQPHEIAHFPQSRLCLGQTEELQMDETAPHAKGLDGSASHALQFHRRMGCRVVGVSISTVSMQKS